MYINSSSTYYTYKGSTKSLLRPAKTFNESLRNLETLSFNCPFNIEDAIHYQMGQYKFNIYYTVILQIFKKY